MIALILRLEFRALIVFPIELNPSNSHGARRSWQLAAPRRGGQEPRQCPTPGPFGSIDYPCPTLAFALTLERMVRTIQSGDEADSILTSAVAPRNGRFKIALRREPCPQPALGSS